MARITPEQLAASGTEDGHQSAFFCWARAPETVAQYPALKWMFAIPNGGARGDNPTSNKIRGAKLKKQGVKAGVVDTFLPCPRQFRSGSMWAGLFMEFKKPGCIDDTSDEQEEFLTDMQRAGYVVAVVDDWESARDEVIGYFNA